MGMTNDGEVDGLLPKEARGHVMASHGGSLWRACVAPAGARLIHQSCDVLATCAPCIARIDDALGGSRDSAAAGPLEAVDGYYR